MRDVQPPQLSDHTTLMSTFYVLLRLLQPALEAAAVAAVGDPAPGGLALFPAAALFGRVGASEVVVDLPRCGGASRGACARGGGWQGRGRGGGVARPAWVEARRPRRVRVLPAPAGVRLLVSGRSMHVPARALGCP